MKQFLRTVRIVKVSNGIIDDLLKAVKRTDASDRCFGNSASVIRLKNSLFHLR